MKLLEPGTKAVSRDAVAAAVMDTALLVVRLLRAQVRRTRPAGLSLNQVRALNCLKLSPDATLGLVAEFLGLAAPSTSHLVEGLVRRGLVARKPAREDRRQIMLRLTARGERAVGKALDSTRDDLAARLAGLAAADRVLVVQAMQLLQPLVTGAAAREQVA